MRAVKQIVSEQTNVCSVCPCVDSSGEFRTAVHHRPDASRDPSPDWLGDCVNQRMAGCIFGKCATVVILFIYFSNYKCSCFRVIYQPTHALHIIYYPCKSITYSNLKYLVFIES